ncbi:hypothetical protein [Burkholderia gladioli]|uniref:hypothetical protein n=1 Tax=Burkholderia gladioli TaxID=28095 RepID=UPI00163F2A67|nr:hypothetical protein [Burkholderia gladioli]
MRTLYLSRLGLMAAAALPLTVWGVGAPTDLAPPALPAPSGVLVSAPNLVGGLGASAASSSYDKLIAFDIGLYTVAITRGGKDSQSHIAADITSVVAPPIRGGDPGLNFDAYILHGRFAGRQGALKLLSGLGNVTPALLLGGTTLDGRKAVIDLAERRADQPPLQNTPGAHVDVDVDASVSAPGAFFKTNLMGQLLPRFVNGAIDLDMTLTLTRLIGIDTLPPECDRAKNKSCMTMPHTKSYDIETFANLKPGESLMLLSKQDTSVSTTTSGVDNPNRPIFGGGVDASQQRTILAIVVTARLL